MMLRAGDEVPPMVLLDEFAMRTGWPPDPGEALGLGYPSRKGSQKVRARTRV